MKIHFKTSLAESRITRGFTLVEILVVFVIIIGLASLVMSMVRRGMDSAKGSTSLSNLRQLHGGIMSAAADNNMNFPVQYFASTPGVTYQRERVWYTAVCRYVYPEIYDNSPTWQPFPMAAAPNGYLGTVLISPNAEKGQSKTVSSYGYNFRFVNTNTPHTYLGRYNESRTCMFADNSGKTHTLGPGGNESNAAINPRNGASGSFKRDGKAAVIYLDGHSETISAGRAKELNGDPDHEFWGITPTP